MNGRAYLRHFPDMPTDVTTELSGSMSDSLNLLVAETTTAMLDNMYRLGEAEFLTDQTPTNTLDLARDYETLQTGYRFVIDSKRRQIIRNSYNGDSHYKPSFSTRSDSSSELSNGELISKINEEQEGDKANLRFHAVGMFAEAVRLRHKFGERRTGAEIVKQAIGNNRKKAIDEIGRSIFAVSQTVDLKGQTHQLEVAPLNPQLRLPSWLRDLNEEREEAIRALTTNGVLEYDAYFAMLRWVVDRGLPLIPIPAPAALEASTPENDQKKPNADLLLCSVETNEIIPIQVKNSLDVRKRDEYAEWMQFLTPSNLGMVEMLGGQPVRTESGRVKTRPLSVIRYGSLALDYIVGNTGKGKKRPGTVQKDMFGVAFKSLDQRLIESRKY